METLLEKAKKFPNNRKKTFYSKEELELAIAWLKGDISSRQAAKAKGTTSGNILYSLAGALREGYFRGLIKIK